MTTGTRVTHRRRVGLALGGLLVLGSLAACDGSTSEPVAASGAATSDTSAASAASDTSDTSAADSSSATSTADASSATATTAPPTPSPGPASPTGPTTGSPATTKPQIILEPDGVGFYIGPATIRHLTFADADAASIKTALTATLGPLKANDLPECGQGPRKSLEAGGFSVLLDGTKFVGWVDQGTKAHRSAANGLALGSTLADVKKKSSGSVQLANDTLGPEFFVENGISGFLDGLKNTSKVTVLYAGETCFFR